MARTKGLEPLTPSFVGRYSFLLSYVHILAGAVGFEPTNGGARDRSLTTWLHPNIDVMVMPAGIEPAFPA